MTQGADPALVREVLRDVLAELLPELVGGVNAPVPAVPPAPVATVHRPSTWHASATTPRGSDGAEQVSLASDAELAAFVERLLRGFENPAERAAIRSGALRFTLRHGTDAPATAMTTERRIEHGAVTERVVREAAATGSSLRLGARAVLTPLARDVARTLGVSIEKEKRC